MSYASQMASYREMEIHAASPEKLVCIVFEQLVINLERARIAMERKDIELRVVSLNRSRGIVTELLTTLDLEKGGPVADQLAALYEFMLYELVDIGRRGDTVTMKKLVNIATLLRDGFLGAAQQLAAQRLKTA
ncbi:flagellar export chaperone FliS [Gemmatimonas aurantiaca]|uniref:flagellar export chaperone FliS n=1 Tax=Gemmatimonas aurantiaca TaxID=173480 RepID=UPI00301D6B8D